MASLSSRSGLSPIRGGGPPQYRVSVRDPTASSPSKSPPPPAPPTPPQTVPLAQPLQSPPQRLMATVTGTGPTTLGSLSSMPSLVVAAATGSSSLASSSASAASQSRRRSPSPLSTASSPAVPTSPLAAATPPAPQQRQPPPSDLASGRIKVFVRVRPLLPHEIAAREPASVVADPMHNAVSILDLAGPTSSSVSPTASLGLLPTSSATAAATVPPSGPGSSSSSTSTTPSNGTIGGNGQSYVFDTVFGPDASNRDVYAAVGAPLVQACLKGFNGTLIAYGQTGTGKTTTLSSPDGMIPRALRQLFRRMHRDRHRFLFKVRMSFLQIYQERIHDLLGDDLASPASTAQQHDLPLREHPDLGVFVEGLTEHTVRSEADLHALLDRGQRRLIFAETKMNRHSSRSHAIAFVHVERHPNRSVPASATGPSSASGGTASSTLASGMQPGLRNSLQSLVVGDGGWLSATQPQPLQQQQQQQQPLLNGSGNGGGGLGYSRSGVFVDTTAAPGLASSGGSWVSGGGDSWFGAGNGDDIDPAWTYGADTSVGGGGDLGFLEAGDPDMVVHGRLTLCDLAGSERVKRSLATGTQLSEAKEINLSLLELGNVIQALAEQKRHVPYRNSTLTRLLQESLGGNCVTSLIVCASPARRDVSETKGTLMFGYRAMRIKTHARINVEVDHEKRANELAETLAQKELEWAERERSYKIQIDDLRASALNYSVAARAAAPSAIAAAVKQATSNLTDELVAERNRYYMVLDAFASAVENMQSAAGAVRALLVHDVAAAQFSARLATAPVSPSSTTTTSPAPLSPLAPNIRRLQDLYLTRGLGEALDTDRAAAARGLLAVAAAAANDPYVETVAAAAGSVRDGLAAATRETRQLAVARLEALVAYSVAATTTSSKSADTKETSGGIASVVLDLVGGAMGSSSTSGRLGGGTGVNNASWWPAQLDVAGRVLDRLAQLPIGESSSSSTTAATPAPDHATLAAQDMAMLSSVARRTAGAVARAAAALQALHAANALAAGAVALDRDAAARVLGKLERERGEIVRAVNYRSSASCTDAAAVDLVDRVRQLLADGGGSGEESMLPSFELADAPLGQMRGRPRRRRGDQAQDDEDAVQEKKGDDRSPLRGSDSEEDDGGRGVAIVRARDDCGRCTVQ